MEKKIKGPIIIMNNRKFDSDPQLPEALKNELKNGRPGSEMDFTNIEEFFCCAKGLHFETRKHPDKTDAVSCAGDFCLSGCKL